LSHTTVNSENNERDDEKRVYRKGTRDVVKRER
jgi:hypothetical protein